MKSHLRIKRPPSSKHQLQNRQLMEKGIIPGHPSINLLIGPPGAGKTSVCWNMVTSPLMWGPSYELMSPKEQEQHDPRPFFDAIFLFLGSRDDSYNTLIQEGLIQPNHVVRDNFIENLTQIIESQNSLNDEADADITKTPKILLIIDDLVNNVAFMKSKAMLTIMTTSRHLNATIVLAAQYIHLVAKPIRVMASFLIIFYLTAEDMKVMVEDYCPADIKKKVFEELLLTCIRPDQYSHHNFLVVKQSALAHQKFRKNFTTYLFPKGTYIPPDLIVDPENEKEDKELTEKYQKIMEKPVVIEPFSINKPQVNNTGIINPNINIQNYSDKPSSAPTRKRPVHYPNVFGVPHAAVYHQYGNAPKR